MINSSKVINAFKRQNSWNDPFETIPPLSAGSRPSDKLGGGGVGGGGAIRHFGNDKRTAVTGAEMLFGDFFPLPLVIVPEFFAKVNWSPL